MSTTQRRDHVGLIDRLLAQPHQFGFFQAVRLLERWLHESNTHSGGTVRPPVGAVTARLYFRNSLSMSFPASEIESLALRRIECERIGPDEAELPNSPAPSEVDGIDITTAFLGLLGGGGTLPLHYTELIAQRETMHRDTSARAFLDVFTHRAASLFYVAWKKHRLHIQYEEDQRDRFLPLLLALSGLGQGGLRDRLSAEDGGVSDESVAYFAGAAQRRPVSAVQLRGLLQAYLGVPVRIEQFVGRWYALPPQACTSLGSCNGVLGGNAVLGERVWQRDLCLRITLGPLNRTHYLRFLPGGAGERALRQWLLLFCGVSFDYEVRLCLHRDAVSGTALRADSANGRLGWDAFLLTETEATNREDVVYDLSMGSTDRPTDQ